ncbi:L-rhamnose mutarotase [Leeuwenhoekiella marinoflava]|uniref:L-rhamnose mutarotase n=2 Tax=Leeuwenhoekiella marinoflava TaxID=988 RepID=A0A4Q0PJH2_9FLAO|nr:L-rhamnose mutarotase [Leeuwenhoekiella marinoflava]RXG27602.1 L-rhamnose mutarotase [Leeuwenhoekiella marinoflava]SHF66791.1 L-rhamnose mutarotase [Leeuwenhoekiella marinoflava DSM 3653]
MQIQAFTMKLKPGFEEEYKKRHDEIWPELQSLLNESGIKHYSIFLDKETGTLFAFQTLEENHTTEAIPQNPIVKKWWAFMADIMETNADNSPIETSLQEVFQLQK